MSEATPHVARSLAEELSGTTPLFPPPRAKRRITHHAADAMMDDLAGALRTATLSAKDTTRQLDKLCRRQAQECDDRLAWVRAMQEVLREEERVAVAQRREVDAVQAAAVRHAQEVEGHVRRHNDETMQPAVSLSEQERVLDEQIAALDRRIRDAEALTAAVEKSETGALAESHTIDGREAECDRQERLVEAEAQDRKQRYFAAEKRLQAADRREESVFLWLRELEAREATVAQNRDKLRDEAAYVGKAERDLGLPMQKPQHPVHLSIDHEASSSDSD